MRVSDGVGGGKGVGLGFVWPRFLQVSWLHYATSGMELTNSFGGRPILSVAANYPRRRSGERIQSSKRQKNTSPEPPPARRANSFFGAHPCIHEKCSISQQAAPPSAQPAREIFRESFSRPGKVFGPIASPDASQPQSNNQEFFNEQQHRQQKQIRLQRCFQPGTARDENGQFVAEDDNKGNRAASNSGSDAKGGARSGGSSDGGSKGLRLGQRRQGLRARAATARAPARAAAPRAPARAATARAPAPASADPSPP